MVNQFKIEKVKWTWPEAVKDKNVYRDDEFIVTKTRTMALAAIGFLLSKKSQSRHCYTITVKRDGKYYTYWRHSMPCLGGLVKYKDTHGDKYWMNPYFPRDIRVSFPEGDITFIGYRHKGKLDSPMQQFLLSDESPWIAAFNAKENIINKQGYFILTDMNTDPTVFYSLLRSGLFLGKSKEDLDFHDKRYDDWHPKAQIIARLWSSYDMRRLAAARPIKTSAGTWAQGYGYTRPFNESIFKTSIGKPFSEFGAQSSYQSDYKLDVKKDFCDVMQAQFGLKVDYSHPLAVTPKNEEILLKAWDYFKEQGRNMSQVPGEKI